MVNYVVRRVYVFQSNRRRYREKRRNASRVSESILVFSRKPGRPRAHSPHAHAHYTQNRVEHTIWCPGVNTQNVLKFWKKINKSSFINIVNIAKTITTRPGFIYIGYTKEKIFSISLKFQDWTDGLCVYGTLKIWWGKRPKRSWWNGGFKELLEEIGADWKQTYDFERRMELVLTFKIL